MCTVYPNFYRALLDAPQLLSFFEKDWTRWIPYAGTNFHKTDSIKPEDIITRNPKVAALLSEDNEL